MSDRVIMKGTTASVTSPVPVVADGNNLLVVVNIESGAGTVTVTIKGVTSSGYKYTLLASTALTGVGVTALEIGRGATPAANLAANRIVPPTVEITTVVTGTISYGVDAISED